MAAEKTGSVAKAEKIRATTQARVEQSTILIAGSEPGPSLKGARN